MEQLQRFAASRFEGYERTAKMEPVEQRVAQPAAAAQQGDEPVRLRFTSLADLVRQLRGLPAGSRLGASIFVAFTQALRHELNKVLIAHNKQTREYVKEQTQLARERNLETYRAEVRAKNAEISALREHNDHLAWRIAELEEALAEARGDEVRVMRRIPSAKYYYQRQRVIIGAGEADER